MDLRAHVGRRLILREGTCKPANASDRPPVKTLNRLRLAVVLPILLLAQTVFALPSTVIRHGVLKKALQHARGLPIFDSKSSSRGAFEGHAAAGAHTFDLVITRPGRGLVQYVDRLPAEPHEIALERQPAEQRLLVVVAAAREIILDEECQAAYLPEERALHRQLLHLARPRELERLRGPRGAALDGAKVERLVVGVEV